MKKRLLSLALCLLLIASILPIGAFALGTINITKQPQSMAVREGDTATFKIETDCVSDNLQYFWFDPDKINVATLELALKNYKNNSSVSFESFDWTEILKLVSALNISLSAKDLLSFNLGESWDKIADKVNDSYLGGGDTYSVEATADKNGQKVQCLVFTTTSSSPTSITFTNLKEFEIDAYAFSEIATIRIDQNAPCQVHTFETVKGQSPTCTEEGWGDYQRCMYCSYNTKADNMLPPAGHKYGEWVVTKESTCQENGAEVETCKICDHTETRAAALVEHNYIQKVTKPTCEARGFTTFTCSVCGFVKYGEYVAALGHDFSNGYRCTRCGELNHDVSPAAPVIKSENVPSTGKIRITWEPVENAVKYEVYRATSKTGKYSLMFTTSGTSYTNTGAVAGNTYYYYVIAIGDNNLAGKSSNIANRTCDCAAPVVTISNDAATGKLVLTWKAVSGASKYEIYRATSRNGTYSKFYTTTRTSFTNTGAEAGKTYYYKVIAVNSTSSYGNSAYSNMCYRTCDCARPTAKVVRWNGHPKVSWNSVTGASKYEVYCATSKNGTYTKLGTTSNTYLNNISATKGTTYYYKVIAVSKVCSAGNSAYSLPVSIKA